MTLTASMAQADVRDHAAPIPKCDKNQSILNSEYVNIMYIFYFIQ